MNRPSVQSTLVYWHCVTYWPLEDGPSCPWEHDTPIYDNRGRMARRRRVWICEKGGDSIACLTRKAFLEHDGEDCHAYV